MKKSFWFTVLAMLLLPVFALAYSEPYPLIQTDKDIYAYGEEIRVHFGNAPGYSSDWICIAPQGSPDTYAGDYKYMSNGMVEGVMIFKGPMPGNYEVRAYYNYSPMRYIVSARFPFTVTPDDYGYIDGGYGDDGYYDAPVVYSEPCYYTPPIVVTFGFDYFTYELSGRYVDIVFWRGGRPYHRRPWNDHGKRITSDYIHSGQWHHKISGNDLLRHRDKLKEQKNIFHPDSYYGIKPGHQIKTGQPSGVAGNRPQPGNKPIPKKFQPKQWERKSPQQTPKSQVWEKPSGRKSVKQIPNNQVSGQPSSQTERKTGSNREKSQDKEKKRVESSGQTEHKTDSNRETSSQSDNRSKSGWGGNSGDSSGGSSSGQSQGSSRDNHNGGNDKKGRW
jgi:hypothetical protein